MNRVQGHGPGISREEFMLRVLASLGPRDAQEPAPPDLPVSLIRRVRAGKKNVERFCQEARKAGMTVDRTDGSKTVETVARGIAGHAGENVLLSCADNTIHAIAKKAAKQANSEILDPKMLSREAVFEARASITDVHAAVAETGSLIMTSREPRARLAHLAPALHMVIVRAEQIAADLYDLFSDERLTTAIQDSAYTALVTGPSKTADIEGVLITGVHGPGSVHVVVIE